MSVDKMSYQKGFMDALNYIIYKILPNVESKKELEKELQKLDASVRELSAAEIQEQLMLL